MEIETNANNCRCFLGENGRPLRLCRRRIDKGKSGKYYRNKCFDFKSSDKLFCILSDSSVVALWTVILKDAVLNLLFLLFCILPI